MSRCPRSLAPSFALLLACAVVATGCAGGGSDAPRRSTDEPTAADGTAVTFSTDERRFMEEALREFSRKDPAWEASRARWLALGERQSEFLVHLMFAGLLRAQKLAQPQLVEQARHELVRIGAPAVPLLAGVLTGGDLYTVYDEIAEEERTVSVDDDARREAAEVLSLIGEPAAPALASALPRAESKGGRRFLLQSLGNMGERGGEPARAAVLSWATTPDWVLRVEAVQALRNFEDPRTRDALIRALSDSEGLVREKAASALAVRGDPAAVRALERAADQARSAGRLTEAKAMQRAVALIRRADR